ncbi:MAG: MipA/OmpV family protein [Deltaproteobacteria bacterium]|nr:MipA/OmpV family protein [Deltaproteobacteria bacterium]
MAIRRKLIVILALAVLWLPQGALGEEKPLWEAGVGGALLYMPDYRGADESRFLLLPYPYLVYRGDFLQVERERISGRLFQTDRLLLDVSLFGNVPVDSSKNEARRGMPDLDPTFEVGPALNVTLLENRENPYKLSLTLPVRAVFSTDFSSLRREGWVFHPRLVFEKADLIPKSGLNLGISAGPLFASGAYHQYFYSVEPAYATAARPAYAAAGGYSGSTLSVGLNKKFDPLIFNAFVGVDFLQGSVIEDSPLVKRKTSLMSGFTVSWVFMKSKKMAPTER